MQICPYSHPVICLRVRAVSLEGLILLEADVAQSHKGHEHAIG